MSRDVRERLADVQHAIWAHWMRYQFSVCQRNEDGSMTIPADKAERWMRQMETSYADLTEQERESDREQADKVILKIRHLLEGAILAEVYGPRLEASEAQALQLRLDLGAAVERANRLAIWTERYGADQWRRGNAGKEPQEFDEWRKLESI